nr:hypothetical protein [Tanacetum cinerariifolium]
MGYGHVTTKKKKKTTFVEFLVFENFGLVLVLCEDVNPFGGGNPRFHGEHHDNSLLKKETESEPIIWDIGDEEEEYPFVNKHPHFKEEPIVLIEEETCPVYDTDNEEKEDGDDEEVVNADYEEALVFDDDQYEAAIENCLLNKIFKRSYQRMKFKTSL